MSAPAVRRLRIDRLDLDLRGIAPPTAEAAARALGPALAKALASGGPAIASTGRLDAGRIKSLATPDAQTLAAGIAQRIAHAIRGEAT
jgi:hypothetical protein